MSIFKTFQKDRKIGLTNFDLSFQNLSTANFGELRPIGCYPVLPKDKWKIGSNILTKVEPMPAPAFTRIKQNVYSFFTPNQSVWKHWNDFVSNGTAYADTYGNNSNTQNVDNLWREPQIQANYVQLISKIANGWAIPIFKLNPNSSAALINYLLNCLPSNFQTKLNSIFLGSDSYVHWNTQKFQVLLLAVKLHALDKASELCSIFDDIPYFELATGTSSSDKKTYFELGCDFVTANKIYIFIEQISGSFSGSKDIIDSDNRHIAYDSNYSQNFYASQIRTFCDNVSDDCEINHGPFILVKRNYCDPSTHRQFTYYAYQKNKYIDNISKTDSAFYSGNEYFSKRITRYCGYFWSFDNMQICSDTVASSSTPYSPFYLNGVAFNPDSSTPPTYDLLSLLGVDFENLASFDELLSLHNFKNLYNDIFFDTSINTGSSIPEIGSFDALTATLGSYSVNPFQIHSSHSSSLEGISAWLNDYVNFVDVNFPLFYDIYDSLFASCHHAASLPPHIFFSYETYNLGYDIWSFIVYSCINSCKFIDSINIPLEGLTSRPFSDYAGEFFKMLLPFSYSKIWNDYFRNKVTSSAELDYSESNSVACLDESFLDYLAFIYKTDKISLPNWLKDQWNDSVGKFSLSALNGWSIPFTCSPKNSLDDCQLNIDGNGTMMNISDFNHFHDLRVRNHWTLFSVLTGSQLFNVSLRNIQHFYDITPSKELFGILANKLYLPSYYNGLLHLKFQNFNKDYFSSALLDPASGANDELIGTTVSSLVTAQAKQGFWNQLAQNRSLKQFWNRMFDIDPSHDDYDKPLLLGSNHTDINVGEVVQLSQTDTTPQGMRSGLGSAHDKSALCKKQFNEHGYIIILCSHTLELQYMQGLEKDLTPNESFLDLPFIDFVGLGNQNILQKELNFTTKPRFLPQPVVKSSLPDGSSNNQYDNFYNFYSQESKINYSYPSAPHFVSRRFNFPVNDSAVSLSLNLANGSGQNLNETFGFIPRYSTWKMKLDQVHGEFRNQLSFWHSFRKFFTQPILCHEFVNWEFVAENDELNRMFFVIDNSTDKFKLDIFINATAARPLPYVCTPATSK